MLQNRSVVKVDNHDNLSSYLFIYSNEFFCCKFFVVVFIVQIMIGLKSRYPKKIISFLFWYNSICHLFSVLQPTVINHSRIHHLCDFFKRKMDFFLVLFGREFQPKINFSFLFINIIFFSLKFQ